MFSFRRLRRHLVHLPGAFGAILVNVSFFCAGNGTGTEQHNVSRLGVEAGSEGWGKGYFLAWVARAWRGHGAGMARAWPVTPLRMRNSSLARARPEPVSLAARLHSNLAVAALLLWQAKSILFKVNGRCFPHFLGDDCAKDHAFCTPSAARAAALQRCRGLEKMFRPWRR
eukprot:gene8751-biopygen9192